jgi:hypothetical protein
MRCSKNCRWWLGSFARWYADSGVRFDRNTRISGLKPGAAQLRKR